MTIANVQTPAREVDRSNLRRRALEARERTLGLASDLSDDRLLGPRLAIVNPPLWELGHVGWFQERWCLRRDSGTDALRPSVLEHADRLYDSSAVPHDTRWDLPLPSLEATLRYLASVFERVLERVDELDPDLGYFVELATLHEEMHCEALTYTRQTLGYPRPAQSPARRVHASTRSRGDVRIAGGEFMLGAHAADGFVFDNEKWAHRVVVAPFAIARTCVSNGEYAAFVDERGYARRELWSESGWRWRACAEASQPVYWRREGKQWRVREYDNWAPLDEDAAVVHVNWFEAEAYCRWAKRRLPSEAEWELAASTTPGELTTKRRYPWGHAAPTSERANLYGEANAAIDVSACASGDSGWGCRQMIGNVWEWTAGTFGPYPGFVPDPYRDYSQPWFGDHKVLRGGAFATRAHLIRNTWRNFYTPDRRDVFAGFRTCE